jgi:hypothetical protein
MYKATYSTKVQNKQKKFITPVSQVKLSPLFLKNVPEMKE